MEELKEVKPIIICIIGETCVGKTTLQKALKAEYAKDTLNFVKTATTRPMRTQDEKDDYEFIDDDKFDTKRIRNLFIEENEFNVNGKLFRYGIPKYQIYYVIPNLILCNPKGVMTLLRQVDCFNLKVIRLVNEDKEEIKRRYLKREIGELSLFKRIFKKREVIKRYKARIEQDNKDFNERDLRYIHKNVDYYSIDTTALTPQEVLEEFKKLNLVRGENEHKKVLKGTRKKRCKSN